MCVVRKGKRHRGRKPDKEWERKTRRSFSVESCVQGATVLLSPPCIFHHTLIFILFSFFLPSKLLCSACWRGISQPCTQSPLVLCVLELKHVCVCAPVSVCLLRRVPMCAYIRVSGTLFAHSLPRLHLRHALTSHCLRSHSPIGRRERGSESSYGESV